MIRRRAWRHAGSDASATASASQDRRVPWWEGREEQRGSPCLPLLLCAWSFAPRPFTRSSFCAFSCFTSQWLLELSAPCGTWGGNDFPASAPGLFASSPPHMAICKMCLLTSLLIFVLSLNSGVY